MTSEWWLAAGSAAWMGILTAISPCPLATNVAAISFISRRVARPHAAILTGLLYTLGRSLVYVVLAALLVSSLLSAPGVSMALQKYMNKLLGPLLILVGMVLLGLIRFTPRGSSWAQRFGQRAAGWGAVSGLALGIVFALSFCPSSAAIYFGGLVPLALERESSIALPLIYGVATGLPVVAFAILIVVSTRATARAFDKVAAFEVGARRITGALFIVIGIYFCLTFIFRLL